MYNEKYHPITDEQLKFAIGNKSYSPEERELIKKGVAEANAKEERHVKITLPSGEFVTFENGIMSGGKAE